jgi:hypothetical protein
MLQISQEFPVTEEEFGLLEKELGDLAHYQAWQLIRRNSRNNHTDEEEDIFQDLRIAMLRAGSYHKRQVYIEECLSKADEYVQDKFMKEVVRKLQNLWENKTRHGANRQKYGPYQEKMLEMIILKYVPANERPQKNKPLKIDAKFKRYCKSITWNQLKSLGKKITRERSVRSNQVSLSEFDYLSSENYRGDAFVLGEHSLAWD